MDRLRNLDILFAEKVLGETGPWCDGNCQAIYKPMCEDCGGNCLPRYTRSLDAAWPGANKSLSAGWLTGPPFMALYYEGMSNEKGETEVSFGSPCGRWRVSAKAMHPAEALVLACLKVAGVPEDQLYG